MTLVDFFTIWALENIDDYLDNADEMNEQFTAMSQGWA